MVVIIISIFKFLVVNRHACSLYDKYIISFFLLPFLFLACQKNATHTKPEDKAQQFLISSQEKDGSWDPKKYGGNFEHTDGKIAVTSLAAIALLKYQDEKSKNACLRASQYLMKLQTKDGSIGERNYANGISFYFFAKTTVENRNINKNAFEKLFKSILNKQSEIGAWDYIEANADRNDMSISAWVCMGLNLLCTQNEYKKKAQEALVKINKMLNKDKTGAGDDSNNTKAVGAYTYGEDPNSPSGKILRSGGTTVQAIILFIKSTLPEFRQSNWVETAKSDQIKSLTGTGKLSLYQTFFLIQSKKNSVKFDAEWLVITYQSLQREQLPDGSWPLNSPPIQFGGQVMATAMGLIILQEL